MKEMNRFSSTRRQFLKYTTIGAITWVVSRRNLVAGTKTCCGFRVLDKNSQIDIRNSKDAIIKKAYNLGFRYEQKHMGCARCTIAALQDAIGFIPEDKGLFRAASCLDGGATPDFSASCGAFTGSGMIIGWICGTGRFGDNSLSHDLMHKVHHHFISEYGSVICKVIRHSTDENCAEIVAMASQWTAEILLEQFMKQE